MVIAIMFVALWACLFLPVVILPFLPQVDTSHAPAPREFVPRPVKPLPTAQHDQAA